MKQQIQPLLTITAAITMSAQVGRLPSGSGCVQADDDWMHQAGRKAMTVLNSWYGSTLFTPAAYAGSQYRSTIKGHGPGETKAICLLLLPNSAGNDVKILQNMESLSC